MRVLVLGAGVVGVSAAYYLAELGCRVTVIEREADVAHGASHANGGQLSYSFTESLAGHGFFAKIPGLIAGSELAIRIRLSMGLLPWGLRFLRQCTNGRAEANTVALLQTAMRSAELMSELRQRTSFDFCYRPAGKIVLLANGDEVRTARKTTQLKKQYGSDVVMLTKSEALAIEPSLAAVEQPIKAAVYSASDEVADARAFAQGLQKRLEQAHDVQFLMNTEVREIAVEKGRVTGVHCSAFVAADAVIVSAGAWSDALLRRLGIASHIYPVRGFSVTLPVGSAAPSASVTSLTNRFVMSRLDGRMRIAGFTDFDGYSTARDAERIDTLVDTARRVAPAAADYGSAQIHPWGGFRPMTPSGRPVVGPTKVPGLFLNTGHGMLGWTLALATGKATADAVLGAR